MLINSCIDEWPRSLSGPFLENQIDDIVDKCLPELQQIVDGEYPNRLKMGVSYNDWEIDAVKQRILIELVKRFRGCLEERKSEA